MSGTGLNIPPNDVSVRHVSALLLELVPDVLDFNTNTRSNNAHVIQADVWNSYLQIFNIPFRLRITGSTIDNTKLESRVKGSDKDVMVIPQNVTVRQEALEYNTTFPCFVRVDLRLADHLNSKETGVYLPTTYLKNMKCFSRVDIIRTFMYSYQIAIINPERIPTLTNSSVGFTLHTLFRLSNKGELEGNYSNGAKNNPLSNISKTLDRLSETIQCKDDQELTSMHKDVEDAFASECQLTLENGNDVAERPRESDKSSPRAQEPETESLPSFFRDSSDDLVPALPVEGWPLPAVEWIIRKRNSPDKQTVQRIISQGVHIVAKPLPINPCSEIDFRLSFSFAEILLAEKWNETQRLTVIIVKACNRFGGSKDLVSYHIKTTMFWLTEKEPLLFWRLENLSTCVKHVVGFLLTCTRRHFLPHYFIRQMNLFSSFDEYSFFEMERKLLEWYHDPCSSVEGFINYENNEANYDYKQDDDSVSVPAVLESKLRFYETHLKTVIHFWIDSLLDSHTEETKAHDVSDTLTKLAECRSHLTRLTKEDIFEEYLFQRICEEKDSISPNLLLSILLKMVSKYLSKTK